MTQKILRLDEIKIRLAESNLVAVERVIGLPTGWLGDLMRGKNKNPSYLLVERLSDHLTKDKRPARASSPRLVVIIPSESGAGKD